MKYYTTDFIREELTDTKTNIKKKKKNAKEADIRKKIHGRIREMKDLGFPKDQALERLNSEFPNSEFSGFFEGWINHVYETKKNPNIGKKFDWVK